LRKEQWNKKGKRAKGTYARKKKKGFFGISVEKTKFEGIGKVGQGTCEDTR